MTLYLIFALDPIELSGIRIFPIGKYMLMKKNKQSPDQNKNTKQNQKQSKSKLWQMVKNLFIVNDYVFDELFNMDRIKMSSENSQKPKDADDTPKQQEGTKKTVFKQPKRAYSVSELKQKKDTKEKSKKIEPGQTGVSNSLDENLDRIKKIFNLPKNKDIVIREFTIPLDPPLKGAIVYIDGAANTSLIDGFVLQPIMLLTNIQAHKDANPIDTVRNLILPVNQLQDAQNLQDIVDGVLNGDTAILLDRSDNALVVETKGWPVRSISDPKSEKVTQGPSDAFNESFRQNLALLRKRLRSQHLITEYFKIGWRSKTDLALVYLNNVVNPALVREMRKRIKAIEIAYVTDTGIIQQLVGDSPYSLIPTSLATERPDRVTAFLNEGHVAIVMDGSPFAIIAPITIWGLLHSPEDYYLNPVVGSFTRIIRHISFFIGVITPAFYIAITNYHPEMIPTDLLLAIAASRENVPFPVIVEVLLMELSFELIREAGVRIPSILGPTIGIVGALVLGQAAVQANIVSPILIIVVAITALGTFTIPNIAFSFTVRISRFIFILLAAVLGFFGISFGLMILTYYVTGLKSLGVAMLSPVVPYRPISGDLVLRRPFFSFDSMPKYTKPKAEYQQVKLIRKWDPVSRNRVKGDS